MNAGLQPGDRRLVEAFARGSAAGLLTLAGLKPNTALSPAGVYWRNFAGLYLTALCHTPQGECAL